jgi:GNAT superfamily N-acetyltransferase
MDHIFTVRVAGVEDARAIASINLSSWLHAYRGIIPDLELDSMDLDSLTDQWKQNLRNEDSSSCTFVAVQDEMLIAYSRFYPTVDPDDDQARVATIGSMYVDPEFQRRGIGGGLMMAVINAVRERGFIEATLHVLAANHRAREFYESLGWEEDLKAAIAGSSDESTTKVRYRKNLL